MALRVFDTGDAEYYLGLGNHLDSSEPIFRDVDFSTIDMLVLEDAGSPGILKFAPEDKQYGDLYNRAVAENPNLPVYGVDVGVSELLVWVLGSQRAAFATGGFICAGVAYDNIKEKEGMSRRAFLKNAGLFAGGGALALANVSQFAILINSGEGEYLSALTDMNSIATSLFPDPVRAFRDALTAKKVSEYLVPMHVHEGRKVRVALLYGAAHSGIELKLKNPWIADRTVDLYKGFFDKRELNEVRELKLEMGPHIWVDSTYADLF